MVRKLITAMLAGVLACAPAKTVDTEHQQSKEYNSLIEVIRERGKPTADTAKLTLGLGDDERFVYHTDGCYFMESKTESGARFAIYGCPSMRMRKYDKYGPTATLYQGKTLFMVKYLKRPEMSSARTISDFAADGRIEHCLDVFMYEEGEVESRSLDGATCRRSYLSHLEKLGLPVEKLSSRK